MGQFLIFFLKLLDDWPEIAVENIFNIVPFFFYAVVGYSVLGEVISPDFFRAVGCADLGISLLPEFLHIFLRQKSENPRP